jgi:hypothetical protein
MKGSSQTKRGNRKGLERARKTFLKKVKCPERA